MRLYLVQHGEAKSKEEDPDRPLTAKGADDVQRIARFLNPLGLGVRAIWHSGQARAAQTAGVLAGAVSATEGVTQREGLAPNDPVEPLAKALAELPDDVMIVGHLPFLGKLASVLVAGDESAGAVDFRPGGVVCLERGDQCDWSVQWAVTADLLC